MKKHHGGSSGWTLHLADKRVTPTIELNPPAERQGWPSYFVGSDRINRLFELRVHQHKCYATHRRLMAASSPARTAFPPPN